MTPDVHRFVGQDEEAAQQMKAFHTVTSKRVDLGQRATAGERSEGETTF